MKHFICIGWLTVMLGSSAYGARVVEASYSQAGCSTSPVSAYVGHCERKLKPKAVRLCLNQGYDGAVEYVPDSFDFDGGMGGACSTAPGRYISYACVALYRCQ